MADISVNGWIAEGGHTIIEGKKNNILLFDVVENLTPVGGIDDDIYKTNSAWFHCSFEINIEDTSKVSFIPTGYTLDRIQSNGWAWLKQEGTTHGWSTNEVLLTISDAFPPKRLLLTSVSMTFLFSVSTSVTT